MKLLQEIKIAWKDDDLLAMVKPQGLATGLGREDNLCTRLFAAYPELETVKGFREGEGGLLHRLDNETGGLVLFACTDESFKYYSLQMKENKVQKKYCAICYGDNEKNCGQMSIPIAHHETKKNRMIRADEGSYRGKPQEAMTEWKIKSRKKGFCLVEAAITKGVRHQIRMHLSLLGLPIAGDRLYKNSASSFLLDDPRFDMHALYCHELSLLLQDGSEKTISTECPLYALWDAV
ncbi:MAG: RNA pseudouridine synthase [Spirochaetaceae bacterium]|nr:MAG: RNA pseudouridine synthase [Spirochaetaceae bacterium]